MNARPPDICPTNGIEARYWGDFGHDVLFVVCLRVAGDARATRYLAQSDVAELARVLRGYEAIAMLSDCHRHIYDLTYIHLDGTFFFSGPSYGRHRCQISQTEATKLADLFEAYLPDALKGGTPMSRDAMQAVLDEVYPEDAALRQEWDAKVATERAKLAIFEQRHPEVWATFRRLVVTQLKAKKDCRNSVHFQLHAKAPDYARRHFMARFMQQCPRDVGRLGWHDELTFRPVYSDHPNPMAAKRRRKRAYEQALKADKFAWERYQVVRFDKRSPEVWPLFRDALLAAIKEHRANGTPLHVVAWYTNMAPAYLNPWFYVARFLTEYPQHRKVLKGGTWDNLDAKYFVPYWNDKLPDF